MSGYFKGLFSVGHDTKYLKNGRYFYCGSLMFFFLSCVCCAFVRVCLFVPCGHLLGKGWPLGSRLWCLLWVCYYPIGILGQVWYLIVSIPDLCTLTYSCKIDINPLRGSAFRVFMKNFSRYNLMSINIVTLSRRYIRLSNGLDVRKRSFGTSKTQTQNLAQQHRLAGILNITCNKCCLLTHISLATFLWDIGK